MDRTWRMFTLAARSMGRVRAERVFVFETRERDDRPSEPYLSVQVHQGDANETRPATQS